VNVVELLRSAESIARTERRISYPSGVAAQHVRDVMRDLLELQSWRLAETAPKDGSHYKVRIDGAWYVVPDDALITEPNKYGKAVVWPYVDADGKTQIRCFMPGAGM
jgi:hypothetical protein